MTTTIEDTSSSLELLEETARVDVRTVSTGTVRVRTVTQTDEETVTVDLAETRATVTRVPVDRIVEAIPDTRIEAGVTIVPVFREEVVVERRIRLVEELHIRTETTTRPTEIPVAVRRQTAHVDRLPVEPPAKPFITE